MNVTDLIFSDMEEIIAVLLSPTSSESEKQKARKALFRGFLGDYAKNEGRTSAQSPKRSEGK